MVFLIGIFIGSFLNVCIYRIPREESIAFPPSHCTNCNKPLRPQHLFPILSYLFLRGKCGYCSTKISLRYPLVELMTGMLFILLYLKLGMDARYIFYASLTCILICITFIDYDYQIIPDGLLLFGMGLGVLYKLVAYLMLDQPPHFLNSLLGLLLGGGFFLLIAILSNGGMGGGDIKLMGMLGFWFGWQTILFITLFAFITGSIMSILLLISKLKSRKDAIPFGPFIVISVFISIFYRDSILSWYINLFM